LGNSVAIWPQHVSILWISGQTHHLLMSIPISVQASGSMAPSDGHAKGEEMTSELSNAKARFRSLWIQRAELEQQLELEIELGAILKKAKFDVQIRNFGSIVLNQLQELRAQKKNGLLAEYSALITEVQNLQSQRNLISDKGESTIETIESVIMEAENLENGNATLNGEVEDLIEQISVFDDEEIHLLRSEKQHIDLTRRKIQAMRS
jgi:hypothetical protein